MADKSKGVMKAIKGRKGIAPKNGAVLVGIMAKLTAKRKSATEDIKDGKGGMVSDFVQKVSSKFKNGAKKVTDKLLAPMDRHHAFQKEKEQKDKEKAENWANEQ